MAGPVCCICGTPLSPPYHLIGGRPYCERHFAQVNKPHRGFWRTGLVQIAVMGVFSILVAALASALGPLDRTALIAAGVLLAIIPTALWLIYFYQQDRMEPEPKTKILEVLLLALLLTQSLGLPLINGVFRFSDWTSTNRWVSLLAYILIAGFVYETIKYFTVRLIVYATDEFDERMDGIVYGSIAGLGVATLLNLNFVLANQGVSLVPGVIQVVTTGLAQASFGGLLGYFMAQAKFEHRPIWWIPVGLALAAILDGLFTWLISEVSVAGLTVDPWRSLLLGLGVALAVFLILIALMQRAANLTLTRPAASEES